MGMLAGHASSQTPLGDISCGFITPERLSLFAAHRTSYCHVKNRSPRARSSGSWRCQICFEASTTLARPPRACRASRNQSTKTSLLEPIAVSEVGGMCDALRGGVTVPYLRVRQPFRAPLCAGGQTQLRGRGGYRWIRMARPPDRVCSRAFAMISSDRVLRLPLFDHCEPIEAPARCFPRSWTISASYRRGSASFPLNVPSRRVSSEQLWRLWTAVGVQHAPRRLVAALRPAAFSPV